MNQVDPIRYAWEGCNLGVPFPAELAKCATVSRLATSLWNVRGEAGVPADLVALGAAQAALHAFIVGDVRRFAVSSPDRSWPVPSSNPFESTGIVGCGVDLGRTAADEVGQQVRGAAGHGPAEMAVPCVDEEIGEACAPDERDSVG
jgi:hypothetical protein